jgi:hypothetical protein
LIVSLKSEETISASSIRLGSLDAIRSFVRFGRGVRASRQA